MNREFISATNVAKMIRKGLKESFPGVKFSVVTDKYAGGASIRLQWENGPSPAMVEKLVKVYQSDGGGNMDDSRKHNEQFLDGEPIILGSDFVFCTRDLSEDIVQEQMAAAATALGIAPPEGGKWTGEAIRALSRDEEDMLSREYNKRRFAYTEFQSPQPSEEFARIQLIGNRDDHPEEIRHAYDEYHRRNAAKAAQPTVATRPKPSRKPGL